MRGFIYFLELLGIAGITGLLAFIPWTKMALGAVLAFLGAFYPTLKVVPTKGQGEIQWKQMIAKFSRGAGIAVVLAGIILHIGAILDGYYNKEEHDKNLLKQRISEFSKRTGEGTFGKWLTELDNDKLRQLLEERLPTISSESGQIK
jgi:hypothetical protein